MVAQVLRRPAAPAKNSVDWEAPAKNGCDHVPDPAHQIIALLPDTYRQIVELRLRQGLSTGQTAQQLHVSRVQFATRLNRAIGMIRRRIDAPRIGTAPH